MTLTVTAKTGSDTAGLRRVLATLCITETASWGVLYYAFPVLSGHISADTGWSAAALTGAFSAALVVSALLGIVVGRLLDRRGPRWLMTTGSVLGVLAVGAVATAPNLGVFVAGWLLAGVAMSAALYPPAFAALTRWYGPGRVVALTVLTLVAGSASTVFAPLTAVLVERFDWRITYLILAGLLAVVTIPGHAFGLRPIWPPAPPGPPVGRPRQIIVSRHFMALVIAMAFAACASSAVVINLVPLLTERGVSTTTAAVTLGIGGAGQVLGRLGYKALAQRLGVRTRTVAVILGVAVTTALLALVTSLAGLIAAAVLAGACRGVMTLLQATAVTERWGAAHYGQLSGVVAAPVTLTSALAPWLGAALATALGGYTAMFWVMGGLGVVAAAVAMASVPSPSANQQHV